MHDVYMKKALELASKGGINVKPNPLVGAVIVKNGHVIGEGYHQTYGEAHAEIQAFNHAIEDVQGATMYVTLEPCSHHGKTGSCAKKIIEKGIKEVYVATLDPNPLVSGKGIQMLKDAGIIVHTGLFQKESDAINKHYYHYITKDKPYVLLKMALTLDGKYATDQYDSNWITNIQSREDVHQVRAQYQAIMVGIHTVVQDNPKLNIRLDLYQGKQPIRIVLDSNGSIPIKSQLIQDDLETWIIVNAISDDKKQMIESRGKRIIHLNQSGKIDLNMMLKMLYKEGIQNVMIEGGKTLHESFLRDQLFDEIQAYIAPKFIGGHQSIQNLNITSMKEALTLKDVQFKIFNDNIKITGRK